MEQAGLALEVVIERRFGQAGGAQNVLDRRARVALSSERRNRRLQDRFTSQNGFAVHSYRTVGSKAVLSKLIWACAHIPRSSGFASPCLALLRQNVLHDLRLRIDTSEFHIGTLPLDGELAMVDAEQLQDGRMQVADVDRI